MTDPDPLLPISDEQAKAAQEGFKATQEALKALQKSGKYIAEILGTLPQDVVALLGGNWVRVARAEQIAILAAKARKRLKARGIEPEPASLSVTLPLLEAAADESREELQEIWARLLAATADPSRARSFRLAFIATAKKLDPLDAVYLGVIF